MRGKKAENSKKEVQDKPRALDLFCGTKSVAKTLEDLGYEVINLDNRKECHATFTVDIRDWDYKKVCNPGIFALIFASIPCAEFSQAFTTRKRDLSTTNAIAKKTLEIIEWLRPEKYFIDIVSNWTPHPT